MSTCQTVRFLVDDIRLAGSLHLPQAKQPPFVIGCHGLLSDRQSPKQIALAEALNQIGIAYFRFDHRGCGESEGDFEITHLLDSRCHDLLQAIRSMQSRSEMGPFAGLFGSSFGGTVSMTVAADIEVPRLITCAAPISSLSIKKPAVREINSVSRAPLPPQTDFEFNIHEKISGLSHILIFHGGNDEIVPLEHARQIYKKAKDPKKLIIQHGGDHRMSNPTHQRRFITECVSWFKNHLVSIGF